MRKPWRERRAKNGPEPAQDDVIVRPHRKPRRRPVWVRITVLLMVPLLSLVGLWGFAASLTLRKALDKFAVTRIYEKIALPAKSLSAQLQQERTTSVMFLALGASGRASLVQQRARTDALEAVFRKSAFAPGVRSSTDDSVRWRLDDLTRRLGELRGLRSAVDTGTIGRLDTLNRYSDIVRSTAQVFSGLMIIDDLKIYQAGDAVLKMAWATEFMMREDTLVASAQASRRRLTVAEVGAFARWAGAGREYFDSGLADMTGSMRTDMQRLADSADYQQYRRVENLIVDSGKGPSARRVREWTQVTPRLTLSLARAIDKAGSSVVGRAEPIGERVILQLAVAGGLGLIAVLMSIGLSILFGRGLGRELRELQQVTRHLAEERLPGVVARLRRGERVDVSVEAPPLSLGRTVEVGRVADALTQVQRTAVESAISEATLRQGISRVFVNLAWRSQSLLHRQLRMLDSMERRAADPEVLEDLFRLDHLTTRMRRHAEGLVILSGASPSREWSRPAPMVDVLRAAAAEVEDYARVEVAAGGEISLVGDVVADIVHLLAELIENATAFSPPTTEVTVRGEPVGKGYAIEIVDRGIGVDEPERARLNEILARPPEFDFADTDRLGLFVVARLAARRKVRVALQGSYYGGVTAIVLLPHALVVSALEHGPGPAPQVEAAAVSGPDPVEVAAARDGAGQELRRDVLVRAEPVEPVEPEAPSLAQPDKPVLTRRKRLANLAPQLRAAPQASAPAGPSWVGEPSTPEDRPPEDGLTEDRPPEESRDLWGAIQGGWQRGRDDDAGGAGDNAPGEGGS